MNRILFPIDTTEEGSEGVKNNKSKTKWEALDPLEMATLIAQMTKEKSALSTPPLIERRKRPPLRIDTNFLSIEDPFLPLDISTCMQNMTIEEFDSTERTYLQSPRHHRAKDTLRSKRERKRTQVYPASGSVVYNKSISHWDLSFLLKHNPDQFAAKDAVKQLNVLARELESSECYKEFIPSYQRLRDRLLEESEFISKNSNHTTKRKSFSKLYASTIEQMHALIEMSEQSDENLDSSEDNITLDERGPGESRPLKPVVNIVRGEYSKIHFTEYMNNWMRENWTNPYPDDDGLSEIAAIHGTSPTAVTNWLINARTRKWRPAIVQAYESGVTSERLRDESLSIFNGKPATPHNNDRVNIVQP